MNGKISIKSLYDELIARFYSDRIIDENGITKIIPFSLSETPSLRQFRYFMNKHVDKAAAYEICKGSSEARNNIRPLVSDTLKRTLGAGHIFEMDEVETQYFLVSKFDRTKVIGRAIMYALVDVYSRMIVGVSVGLDNNSWAGATLALLNMVENKVEFCEKYEEVIKEDEWPVSNCIPKMIRCDNGSEYTSKNFMKLVEEMGITISHVPTRSGSLKPNIEQKFNQLNYKIDGKLPGQIYKEYNSRHKQTAALDIDQFTKIVIKFVKDYNSNFIEKYPINKEMLQMKLIPTPINLWNYSLVTFILCFTF